MRDWISFLSFAEDSIDQEDYREEDPRPRPGHEQARHLGEASATELSTGALVSL